MLTSGLCAWLLDGHIVLARLARLGVHSGPPLTLGVRACGGMPVCRKCVMRLMQSWGTAKKNHADVLVYFDPCDMPVSVCVVFDLLILFPSLSFTPSTLGGVNKARGLGRTYTRLYQHPHD